MQPDSTTVSTAEQELRPGDRVVVLGGALDGSKAIVDTVLDERRARVGVHFFGRVVSADVELGQLEKV